MRNQISLSWNLIIDKQDRGSFENRTLFSSLFEIQSFILLNLTEGARGLSSFWVEKGKESCFYLALWPNENFPIPRFTLNSKPFKACIVYRYNHVFSYQAPTQLAIASWSFAIWLCQVISCPGIWDRWQQCRWDWRCSWCWRWRWRWCWCWQWCWQRGWWCATGSCTMRRPWGPEPGGGNVCLRGTRHTLPHPCFHTVGKKVWGERGTHLPSDASAATPMLPHGGEKSG